MTPSDGNPSLDALLHLAEPLVEEGTPQELPRNSLPAHPAEPRVCPECLCPVMWEDLARQLHCCECVPIPSRSMARDAWRLELHRNDSGTLAPTWRLYEFTHWNPFGHLEGRRDGEERQAEF